MYKILFSLMLSLFCGFMSAQTPNYNDAKYLAGAVPEEGGFVVFRENFDCPGLLKEEIYPVLEDYAKSLLTSDVHLVQCRITQATPEEGVVAASMEETLTFRRAALVLDTSRIFYQVVFTAYDGGFEAVMRRIRYLYEPMQDRDVETVLAAEDWITDKEALNRHGQLRKVGGKKFRYATINRKDAIFQGALKAVRN